MHYRLFCMESPREYPGSAIPLDIAEAICAYMGKDGHRMLLLDRAYREALQAEALFLPIGLNPPRQLQYWLEHPDAMPKDLWQIRKNIHFLLTSSRATPQARLISNYFLAFLDNRHLALQRWS